MPYGPRLTFKLRVSKVSASRHASSLQLASQPASRRKRDLYPDEEPTIEQLTTSNELHNDGTTTGASDDRLTISRLLILTGGIALGLVLFGPLEMDSDDESQNWWTLLWFSPLAGIALVSPLFVIRRRIRGHKAGVGGMLLLTLGVGVLMLVPSVILERIGASDSSNGYSTICLAYCIPLICLWYLIAAAVGGQLTRASFRRCTPWVERLGLYLAIAAAPLGLWLIFDIYRHAFF